MTEETPKSESITIKKESLWKYSTFILVAILIVGAFIFFRSGTTSGNAVNTGNTAGNAAAGAATGPVDVSAFTGNSDIFPSIGPANAPATVIEFADFQCPYCALASGQATWASQYSQYSDLINAGGKAEKLAQAGKIKFIFVTMNFLDQGKIGESNWAAEAAYCANDQGKFWEMHDAIYKASDGPSEDNGKYAKTKLETIAQSISGLDQTKFKSCLESDADLSKVQQSQQAASAVVQGTPTFFVNGQQVNAGWSTISAALQSAGVSTN